MSEMQTPPWARITFDNLIAHMGPAPKQEHESERVYAARVDDALRAICDADRKSIIKFFGWNKKPPVTKDLGRSNPTKPQPPTVRKLLEGAVCIRWGCAPDTLRAFFVGRRRPGTKKNPTFFDDLRKYGRATVVNGKIAPGTLNTGPDYMEFDRTTPAGGDRSRAAAA